MPAILQRCVVVEQMAELSRVITEAKAWEFIVCVRLMPAWPCRNAMMKTSFILTLDLCCGGREVEVGGCVCVCVCVCVSLFLLY